MNVPHMGMTRSVLFTAIMMGAVSASQAAIFDIPITNPGAESGSLVGWTSSQFNWPIDDYAAVISPPEAPEGDHYFELDLSIFPSDPLDFANGSYPPSYRLTQGRFDLSAYSGKLEDIFISAWTRNDNLALVVEDGTGTYEYSLGQYLSIDLVDARGNIFYGLGNGTWSAAGWVWQNDRNFSWWDQWDARKDEIAAIDIELETRISNWDSTYSGPQLKDIDPSTVIAAYYTWTGADGNDYSGLFSDYGGDQLPIVGFDGVELKVSAVPLPAAFWLFASGIVGVLGVARKRLRLRSNALSS